MHKIILITILIGLFSMPTQLVAPEYLWQETEIKSEEKYVTVDLGWRIITAYNPVESQTDNNPCLSASGLNVCETEKNIFASNEFDFGDKILINGVIWECQDRTNFRYKFRIDLLMKDYQEAINWGRKTLKIKVIN